METIAEAKQFLRENWKKGTVCPCCNQRVKLYLRKLNSGMALFLIGLYRLSKKNAYLPDGKPAWFTNKEVMKEMGINTSSLDYSVLRHWELIKKKEANEDGVKRQSGYWQLTLAGLSFVQGHFSVKEKVNVYNNKRYGFSGNLITIKQALGSKFNYTELMEEQL